jgi:hypothetical protein
MYLKKCLIPTRSGEEVIYYVNNKKRYKMDGECPMEIFNFRGNRKKCVVTKYEDTNKSTEDDPYNIILIDCED